jgi:hypothetical protein
MKPYSGQGIAGNSPTQSVEVDLTPPPGYIWEVYQIGITTTSVTATQCSVYVNQRFYCGSNVGNADAADGSPLSVKYSDLLRFVWSNVSAGAVCNVYIQVEEYLIGSGPQYSGNQGAQSARM